MTYPAIMIAIIPQKQIFFNSVFMIRFRTAFLRSAFAARFTHPIPASRARLPSSRYPRSLLFLTAFSSFPFRRSLSDLVFRPRVFSNRNPLPPSDPAPALPARTQTDSLRRDFVPALILGFAERCGVRHLRGDLQPLRRLIFLRFVNGFQHRDTRFRPFDRIFIHVTTERGAASLILSVVTVFFVSVN